MDGNATQAEEATSPSSEQDQMDSPHGWRSGFGLRRKAKAFVKQHLDGARKIIEESLHDIGDKIVTFHGQQAITESNKETISEDEVVVDRGDDTSESFKSTPVSVGPDAPQEAPNVEILGPLSKDVHERFEGAKKILKSSMASIGDTAGSLLRFKADDAQVESKGDSGSDEASIEPTAPKPPQSPRGTDSVAISRDESDADQKNVWGPIRKAIDGIVQPSQQIGKHLIQVWDLHDLVDDLKEQRNLWRQRRVKDAKESDTKEGEASGEDASQEDASLEDTAHESISAQPEDSAEENDDDKKSVFLY
jgi:hypothetical protein